MVFDLLVQQINLLCHIIDLVGKILIQLREGDLLLADQCIDVLQFFYFLFMSLHLRFKSCDVGDLGG